MMWKRTYLILLLIRVYLALSPSYIHPDEHFQGPEVLAKQVYSYPAHLTWEFTSSKPIRSIFPLWLSYGLPMTFLKWSWSEAGTGNTPPYLIFYVLRATMLGFSFVLEDWAIHELITSTHRRRKTVVLVASSYVTWTYQTHTFSNSIETLLVSWSLVLIQRIIENSQHSSVLACSILAFTTVAGVFNRITFPAFIAIPALQLIPHFLKRPYAFVSIVLSGLFFSFVAVYADTSFFSTSPTSLADVFRRPIITPLNNLLYNSDKANLASHGLHPRYQHFLINAPQLLGPVYPLLIISIFWRSSRSYFSFKNARAISALAGITILSIFPHQEPRFLIPCIPLLLSCVELPNSRIFVASWILFNSIFGVLMGVYHQGGVVPTQLQIPAILSDFAPEITLAPVPKATADVFWWKTYSPPLWLLGDASNMTILTHDLMGMSGPDMLKKVGGAVPKCSESILQRGLSGFKSKDKQDKPTLLVAPDSAVFLDTYTNQVGNKTTDNTEDLRLDRLWKYDKHLNLDDMDFGDDGILPTLSRVVGRHGISVWLVSRACN